MKEWAHISGKELANDSQIQRDISIRGAALVLTVASGSVTRGRSGLCGLAVGKRGERLAECVHDHDCPGLEPRGHRGRRADVRIFRGRFQTGAGWSHLRSRYGDWGR